VEVLDLDNLLSELAPESEFDGIVNGDTLDADKPKVKEDDGTRKYRELTVYDILPKTGLHLGLDISKSSTGVSLVEDGVIKSWNISLQGGEDIKFAEILLRRELKQLLLDEFKGLSFGTIVLEDVYDGNNPETTRLLYSLNTVIDEIILDGDIECEDFVRANNKSWKSWLWSIEPQIGKGYNEKARTEEVLKYLGVNDSGKGFQDRLDSLGMLVGYFFKKVSDNLAGFKVPRVTWTKVKYVVVKDVNALDEVPFDYRTRPIVEVDIGRKTLTKEYIKYLVGLHSGKLIIIKSNYDLDLAFKLLDIPWGVKGTLAIWGI